MYNNNVWWLALDCDTTSPYSFSAASTELSQVSNIVVNQEYYDYAICVVSATTFVIVFMN